MTELAIRAVQRLKRLEQASDQHVEASYSGELGSQDLYFLGIVKGIGKIYMQSAVDCSCSVAFAKLCVSKQPITSVALVHERVLPFYESLGVQLKTIVTDCGREYCGRPDSHFFELDEFFSKAFLEKIYTSVNQLQQDLDGFLEFYNSGRIHSGYRCEGKTSMATLKELLATPIHVPTEIQAT